MRLDAYTPTLQDQLSAYTPRGPHEREHLARVLSFVSEQAAPYARSTQVGHITASAILVDDKWKRVGLIWHQKLERWLQPGGHCEAEDATLPDAALRELVEETSIAAEHLHLISETPFDIDVHRIPARGDEPAHDHYDIRYLFRTAAERLHFNTIEENGLMRWQAIEEVASMPDISQARYAQKLLVMA